MGAGKMTKDFITIEAPQGDLASKLRELELKHPSRYVKDVISQGDGKYTAIFRIRPGWSEFSTVPGTTTYCLYKSEEPDEDGAIKQAMNWIRSKFTPNDTINAPNDTNQ